MRTWLFTTHQSRRRHGSPHLWSQGIRLRRVPFSSHPLNPPHPCNPGETTHASAPPPLTQSARRRWIGCLVHQQCGGRPAHRFLLAHVHQHQRARRLPQRQLHEARRQQPADHADPAEQGNSITRQRRHRQPGRQPHLHARPAKPDPSFVFPQSETAINQWTYNAQDTSEVEHSWGMWSGLTRFVGNINGTPVRAFETWSTPKLMIYQTQWARESCCAPPPRRARGRASELSLPHRAEPPQATKQKLLRAPEPKAGASDTRIFVSASYNRPRPSTPSPTSCSCRARSTSTQAGLHEVPDFPSNAITIKPVYKVNRRACRTASTRSGVAGDALAGKGLLRGGLERLRLRRHQRQGSRGQQHRHGLQGAQRHQHLQPQQLHPPEALAGGRRVPPPRAEPQDGGGG